MKKAKPFIIVGVIVIVLVTAYFIFFKDKADPTAEKLPSIPGPGKDTQKTPGTTVNPIDPAYITDITKGFPVIPGQKSENVKTIQKALNQYWKAGLPITGTWADKTTIAITKAGYPLRLFAKDIITLNAGKKYQK